MDIATLVGGAAAIASVTSFVPQAWKIIKSRDTADLSAWMYGVTTAGFSLWLIYGVMLGQWPLMVTNAICLGLAAFIFAMIVLPQRKKDAVADVVDVT